jgi:hypothetical protein
MGITEYHITRKLGDNFPSPKYEAFYFVCPYALSPDVDTDVPAHLV